VRLLAEGAQVRILDNLSSGRQENLDACPQAEFLPGDITSPEDARRAVSGCDVVFHHAALVSVQESIRSPERSFAVNSGGTACMLWAAHRAGVKRFVLASSAAVYGDDPRQGYFDGAVFYHPDLKLQMVFPAGWRTNNGFSAVTGLAEKQDGLVQLELGDTASIAAQLQNNKSGSLTLEISKP